MSFGFSFRPPGPLLRFPGYDKTYTAAQWYERYWNSIQLNLDEGTVLAFICQCSSECPVIPSQSCAGENASRPDHRPIANMEGQRRPRGLCPCLQPTALPVMLDILYSVAS